MRNEIIERKQVETHHFARVDNFVHALGNERERGEILGGECARNDETPSINVVNENTNQRHIGAQGGDALGGPS